MYTQFYFQFPIAHIRYFGRQRGDGAATHPILWDFRRISPKTSLKFIYIYSHFEQNRRQVLSMLAT